MFQSLKKIIGFTIKTRDGEIGHIDDVFFDDEHWIIRYIVIKTGIWLQARRVLISPESIENPPDWINKTIILNLTNDQVKNSPEIDADKPVSRQKEIEIIKHYNWRVYWQVPSADPLPGANMPSPTAAPEIKENFEKYEKDEKNLKENHLRSIRNVGGYKVRAVDGQIGHIDDFIATLQMDKDEENIQWIIRYIIVKTRDWLPGKKVIISPMWLNIIDWDEKKIFIEMTRDQIEAAPEFNAEKDVNKEYENHIFDYYGREKYWE